jgi:hypothetical protein
VQLLKQRVLPYQSNQLGYVLARNHFVLAVGCRLHYVFYGAALETRLRWVSWIHITGCHLVAFGAGKCERLGVNSSGVGTDYEGFGGH